MELFEKVFKNTIEMLKDREYILPKNINDIDLNSIFKNKIGTIFVKKIVDKNEHVYKKVMIFFSIEKFGIKELRIKVEEIEEEKIDHVIFILDNKFTSHGQRLLNQFVKLHEEIFYFYEMMINPTKHEFTPMHELLTDDETNQFIKQVGTKIPCIKISDRICRHFNGKIGQIFRIYRKNVLTYRIVAK